MPNRQKTKPAKPYKDFPLYAHGSGQWAKKINQVLYYFGRWDDPDAALQKYLAQRDYLQAGLAPPEDAGETTLAQLCNQFLTSRKARVASGELARSTWMDYHATCKLLIDHFGKTRPKRALEMS